MLWISRSRSFWLTRQNFADDAEGDAVADEDEDVSMLNTFDSVEVL